MGFLLLGILVGVGVSGPVRAEKLPDWVLGRPPPTRVFKFYLGRSGSEKSERDALREAMNDATEQATRENFGFYTQVQSESTETLKETRYSKRTSEESERVRFVEFEQINLLITNDRDRSVAYVLYRYPVRQIDAEKARLKRLLKSREKPEEVHEIGEGKNRHLGSVEVFSKPSGAEVRIDHRSWGKTPVRIRGALEPGEHLVDLLHPDYEPEINGTFIAVPGQMVTFQKILQRKEVVLKIRTEPEGAIVSVDGKIVDGVTPNEVKAYLGDTLNLSLSHPEVNPETTQVKVSEELELPVFNLIYKPARMLLDSLPSGAEVRLDGKRVGRTGEDAGFGVSRGKHEVKLAKTGYEDEQFEVEVKGGETKVVPTKKLTSVSLAEVRRREEALREEEERRLKKEEDAREASRREAEEREERRESEIRIARSYPGEMYQFSIGYVGVTNSLPLGTNKQALCCFSFGLAYQWRIHGTVYFRGQYSFGLGEDYPETSTSYLDNSEFLTSHDLNVGLPLYFGENLRLGPEIGAFWSNRLKSQGSFDQTFYGVNLGFDQIYQRVSGMGLALKVRKYSDPKDYKGGVYVMVEMTFHQKTGE